MTTALLIIGVFVLILTMSFTVLVTVLVFRALSRAFLTLDRMQDHSARHVDSILDRLMTIKWEDFAALRSVGEDVDGGEFLTPEEQREDDEVSKPAMWGHLSALRERISLTEDEQALLDEDFPEVRS